MRRSPHIVISLGDPGGIGPEVTLRALADEALRRSARWSLVGSVRSLEDAARVCGLPPLWTELPDAATSSDRWVPAQGEVVVLGAGGELGKIEHGDSATQGEVSFQSVQRAVDLALLPASHPWSAAGVVTAPISKRAWALAGHQEFPGHTELLAQRCGTRKFAMMFHAPPALSGNIGTYGDAGVSCSSAGLNVILTTTHIPLARVAGALTTERVLEAIELGAVAMRGLGVANARVGVCGLNPHAGEQGLLGDEDDRVISPAIARAQAMGIDASGPWPADTIFQGAVSMAGRAPARFDLVVAMYHDQGLIPLKTLAWDRAVNMTVGLTAPDARGGAFPPRPIIRTSPDHGTAFDIAGRGVAHAGSMRAAMELAVKLAVMLAGERA